MKQIDHHAPAHRAREENARRAYASAEAQIVFRHFARVLERLVPPPQDARDPVHGRRVSSAAR